MKKAVLDNRSGLVLDVPREGIVSMLILEWLAQKKIKSFKVSMSDECFHIRMEFCIRETYLDLKDFINANIPQD